MIEKLWTGPGDSGKVGETLGKSGRQLEGQQVFLRCGNVVMVLGTTPPGKQWRHQGSDDVINVTSGMATLS